MELILPALSLVFSVAAFVISFRASERRHRDAQQVQPPRDPVERYWMAFGGG